MIQDLLTPTTELDTIREIAIIVLGLVFRFIEKRRLKKQLNG